MYRPVSIPFGYFQPLHGVPLVTLLVMMELLLCSSHVRGLTWTPTTTLDRRVSLYRRQSLRHYSLPSSSLLYSIFTGLKKEEKDRLEQLRGRPVYTDLRSVGTSESVRQRSKSESFGLHTLGEWIHETYTINKGI